MRMDQARTVSGAIAVVRDRLASCDFSRRQIAREAVLSWATIRRFEESGAGNAKTVAAIEAALDRLQGSCVGTDHAA